MEPARISRRAVLATAAAATLRAEQTAAQPAAPDDELKAAEEAQRSNYDQMRKSVLPFFTEPATVFRA